MRLRQVIGLILLCILIGNVYSETVELNMQDAVERVLEVNLDLKKGSYDFKKYKISRESSWNVFVPSISAGGTISRTNSDMSENSQVNQWSLQRNISLSYPILRGLAQNVLNFYIPYKEYKNGAISYEELFSTTVKNVQEAYIDLYIAEENLEYLEERVLLETQKELDAKKAYESGLRDEYSYLQTQLLVLQSAQARDQQRNAYSSSLEKFAILLDYPIDTEFLLTEEIARLKSEEVEVWVEENDISNNYSLSQLDLQEDILKLNRLKTAFAFIPSLSLSWTASNVFQKDPEVDNWFDNSYEYWGDDTGSLRFTLSIPLSEYYPWSPTSVALRQLNEDIKSNEISTQLTRENLNQQLLQSQRNLRIALESMLLQDEQLALAERAYELADDAYSGGLMDVNSYQEAGDALYKAQVDQLTNQGNIIKNILAIHLLLGESTKNPSIDIYSGANDE